MRVSRSSEGAKNTATRVGMCPQDAVTESLDGVVDPAKAVQCEPAGLVWYEVLELFVRALVVSYESDSVVGRGSTITLEPLTGGVGQVSRRVFPLLVSKRPIRVHYVYIPQPVVLPMGEAEVRTWVNTKLRTETLVRGNVVGVILLIKGWVVRQSVLALNSAHLVQDLSRGVVHVKLIKGSDLLAEIQTGREQHFTRNTTPRCRAPESKVQLLWPKAHVRLGKPLPRVLCGCELDLGLGEDLSELGCEIVRWRYIDLHLLVKDIRDALGYVVREIDRRDW